MTLPLALACRAGEHEGTGRIASPQAYVQECAACHVAYQPQMLPAASWARLMRSLDKHFGTDASLDAADVQQLSRWLQENADRRLTTPAPPEDRITRTTRFERKHRQIEPATWRLPSVRSASNCMACHTGADKGQYSEHALRMPEGLSARQRSAWDD
ncbi:diheme cytochrome c [Pelomonas sp. P8]|uniref:Diheme cytochrome c n=1 Tax=Pelomonas cellulosilytica TaxID=2906762 RepID=A0ABS8Y0M2_9BURK|nr:diheme cytochrome c [Pelomonas sp. P8]MCE4557722.1 diheme cytochrome c [Pelomonas sp. P8]